MKQTDLLDPDKIKANLQTETVGGKIVVFNSTSSTNDVAAEYAKNAENNGLVVLAEEQTAGRGRGGNKWLSGQGDSILCSVVLTGNKLGGELLSLVCAVAVAEAIGKVGGNTAKIKWPNDIILNGKKVAGILLESQSVAKGNNYIIGIGINCHQEAFAGELEGIATSIDIESGAVCDRISIIKRFLTSLEHWLKVAEKNGKKVIGQWKELSIQLGHRIKLLYNGEEFAGSCIGIDPKKGLIVQLDGGAVRFFDAASYNIDSCRKNH